MTLTRLQHSKGRRLARPSEQLYPLEE